METTATAIATATGVVLDYNFLPLDFDCHSTYGRIFQVCRDQWSALTGIALVMYAVGWIFFILLGVVWGNDLRIVDFSSLYSSAFKCMWSLYGYAFYGYAFELESGFSDLAFYVVEVALCSVLAGVAHGASVLVTMHWYVHQSQPPMDAVESALRKCGSLVGVTALLALLVLLPALLPAVTLWLFAGMFSEFTVVAVSIFLIALWVVWSLYISIITSTVYAVIMAEGRRPWASIQRSYSLGQGQWDYIVGILAVWVVSKAILSIVVAYCSILGDQIVTNVLGTIIGILLLAIEPVVECVLYLNLRVHKEELDRVTLGGELGSEPDSDSDDNSSFTSGESSDDDLELCDGMVPSVATEPAPAVLAELPALA